MARMIDVIALAKKYCPEAEIRLNDNTKMPILIVDIAQAVRVFPMHTPETGWIVQIDNLNIAFELSTEEAAIRLTKALVTQIEISKDEHLEAFERIQSDTVEQLKSA